MRRYLFFILLLLGLSSVSRSQVSHGGRPLPISFTRSMDEGWFEEMPAFDVVEQLRIDSLDGNDLRSGYRFAYKYLANYDRTNSGTSYTLADGTRVWRLGIRSKGALSINVLFSEFELPEGACLFLYNKDQTHVLGAFNHLNNSELGILPVSPVWGDELIVEYQEPAHVSFPGRLTLGEINHAYRSLRGREPDGERSSFYCMEPVSCFAGDPEITDELGRSVVLLIVNGTAACSGVMINNTANDGKPYLLTASHCINDNFKITDPEGFDKMAGSVICYFNYNSPKCDPVLRGTEELSVASSRWLMINENHDSALLELLETPPAYYQPYYAGWNASEQVSAPYFGIHHPSGTVKRVNWMGEDITYTTFITRDLVFSEDAHWHVKEWTSGSTAKGSSGSPLFTIKGEVIGGLSGGFSYCHSPINDYFFALSKAWEPEKEIDRQFKYWLDAKGEGKLSCKGLDPFKEGNSCFRLSNVKTNGNTDAAEVTPYNNIDTVPLFGNNESGITMFVEEYNSLEAACLDGVYLFTHATGKNLDDLQVEICVFTGKDKPETLIHSEIFQPAYLNRNDDEDFIETNKPLDRDQESFIRFSKDVNVKGRFFVGFRIVSIPKDNYFSVFNLPEKVTTQNTSWLSYKNNWIPANKHPKQPMKTSLFIDPVLHYADGSSNSPDPHESVRIHTGIDRQTLYVLLPEKAEQARLVLISMDGRIREEQLLPSPQSTVRLSTKMSGVYVARVTYDGKQYSQKVIF